jgi:UDP-N-acetylenolpyruvoylglucosamine reductase
VIRMATRGIDLRLLGDNLVEVIVQAGEPLSSLVAFTVAEGLSGIEYLAASREPPEPHRSRTPAPPAHSM